MSKYLDIRLKFIKDVKEGTIIKGNRTFRDLASMYKYPPLNGENLCKKDYYKALKSLHDNGVSMVPASTKYQGIEPDLNNFFLSTFKIDKQGNVCDKWYRAESQILEIDWKEAFKEAISDITVPKFSNIINNNSLNLLAINLTDVHLNKNYIVNPVTLDEQINILLDSVNYALTNTNNYGKILLIIGHDYLHSEFNNQTTKGTPQDTLEPFDVLFKKALKATIQIINMIVNKAPVDVIWCNGNHAFASELQLFAALEVYYDHISNKNIRLFGNSLDRKYYEFHNNSFMLVHDTRNKISDLPLLFSIEKPDLFIKKNKYILSGHLHSKKEVQFISSSEKYGIEHIQCPSLSGEDKWHHDNFYVGNKERMLSLLIHPESGIINHIIYNKDDKKNYKENL